MTLDLSGALRERPRGVLLLLDVTPGSKEARFPDGYDPWRERVGARVRSPPEGGRANQEVCALVAKHFGLGGKDVAIIAGHTSRQKTVSLAGVTRLEVLRRLEEAIV